MNTETGRFTISSTRYRLRRRATTEKEHCLRNPLCTRALISSLDGNNRYECTTRRSSQPRLSPIRSRPAAEVLLIFPIFQYRAVDKPRLLSVTYGDVLARNCDQSSRQFPHGERFAILPPLGRLMRRPIIVEFGQRLVG